MQSVVQSCAEPIMSFYHILTSNVAPETFPNNCASQFSTPIHNPHDLNGKWEVALTQMTHSNCVNTFNGENFVIEDASANKDVLERLNTHMKIKFSFSKSRLTRDEFIMELKENVAKHGLLKHILKVENINGTKQTYWKVLHSDFFIVLSKDLQSATQVWSPVITAEDKWAASTYDLVNSKEVLINEANVIIGKKTVNVEHYVLKDENTEMTIPHLMKVYNDKLPSRLTSMTWHSNAHVKLSKWRNDDTVLLLNKGLNDCLHFNHAAYLFPDTITFEYKQLRLTYDLPWIVTLIRLKPESETFIGSRVIHRLNPKQFTTQREACTYLNTLDNRVSFSCNEQNIVSMNIHSNFVTVKFDNDLRDILAFDKNEYKGSNIYTASGILSLTRRIHYLYVYNNISQYIRIGDTQAPLLAILPFDGSTCVPHVERTFKFPMYTSLLRNHIAQIDIEIRDDAGQLVPFTKDALSTLRLHFRQVYANV